MSFICAVTKQPSKPKEKPHRLVVETRPKVYENIDNEGNLKLSAGKEIVKEILVSDEGLRQLDALRAKIIEEGLDDY